MVFLSTPAQLTLESHATVLVGFRAALALWCASESVSADLPTGLRVREWQFVVEDGQSVVRVFLDAAESLVSINLCLSFHRWLRDCNPPVLDMFADHVVFEFSSKGVEPFFRDVEDFQQSNGIKVCFTTWENIAGTSRFVGKICGISSQSDKWWVELALEDSTETIMVPLEQMKSCSEIWEPRKGVKSSKGRKAKSSSN